MSHFIRVVYTLQTAPKQMCIGVYDMTTSVSREKVGVGRNAERENAKRNSGA